MRRAIGDFTLAEAVAIEDLPSRPIEEHLLPPLAAVAHLPRWLCAAADREELLRGRPVACLPDSLRPAGSLFALVDDASQLLALAEYDSTEGVLRPRQVYFNTDS